MKVRLGAKIISRRRIKQELYKHLNIITNSLINRFLKNNINIKINTEQVINNKQYGSLTYKHKRSTNNYNYFLLLIKILPTSTILSTTTNLTINTLLQLPTTTQTTTQTATTTQTTTTQVIFNYNNNRPAYIILYFVCAECLQVRAM